MNAPTAPRVLATLGELGLAILGAWVALWVVQRTGSVLLAAWCCFLIQTLRLRRPSRRTRDRSQAPEEARFERARCQAEAALARLAAHRGRRRRSVTHHLRTHD